MTLPFEAVNEARRGVQIAINGLVDLLRFLHGVDPSIGHHVRTWETIAYYAEPISNDEWADSWLWVKRNQAKPATRISRRALDVLDCCCDVVGSKDCPVHGRPQ